jgi:hypothetical protein
VLTCRFKSTRYCKHVALRSAAQVIGKQCLSKVFCQYFVPLAYVRPGQSAKPASKACQGRPAKAGQPAGLRIWGTCEAAQSAGRRSAVSKEKGSVASKACLRKQQTGIKKAHQKLPKGGKSCPNGVCYPSPIPHGGPRVISREFGRHFGSHFGASWGHFS